MVSPSRAKRKSPNITFERVALLVMLVLAILLAPLDSTAQSPEKVRRIGFLTSTPLSTAEPVLDAFRQGLRAVGWVEGQNIVVEYRFEPKAELLAEVAAELLGRGIDVLVTWGTPAGLAAKRSTSTMPIAAFSGDPVANGLVRSLPRPGGNITGIASIHGDVVGKRLELLREAAPKISRLAVFLGPTSGMGAIWNEMQPPALALGLKLRRVEVRSQGDVERALNATTRTRDDALFVAHDLVLFDARRRINDFALKHRLPTSFALREYVGDGGLMSYGVSFADLWRRMGYVVDKLLRGARPADLPIEQPTKFELVINARTAKGLGLTIPPSILQRADQVIE